MADSLFETSPGTLARFQWSPWEAITLPQHADEYQFQRSGTTPLTFCTVAIVEIKDMDGKTKIAIGETRVTFRWLSIAGFYLVTLAAAAFCTARLAKTSHPS